ncbi:hypothetical protein DNTS_016692 [Danionella cerebrum]|uniref:[histone H3]-lysine(4) N-trimethyltransferase n=1 Tax=Danionella cerebrum TaxID=2873325 RepID=A0A553QEE3_9TELE|nr:hypothetical protein DNTS_016692 [Danionella translucida]
MALSRAMTKEGIEGTERFPSPGKGRGLKATKQFKVGDLVFACPAYAYVLTANERGGRCECCFTRREGLSKCGKCKEAYYCNVECQRGDWPMHKLECSAMCSYGENWSPSETVRLVARILLKQKCQTERTPSERLLTLKELEAHLDKMDSEKNEMNDTDIAALHHFYSRHLDYPDNAALTELIAQVNCNGFTIEDEELSHLGSALFPDVALMNHSCSPNVIVTYKGTIAEIFNSYIDLLYPTEDRVERLKDSYFFTCDCKECTSKSKDKAKMELRQKLNTPPEEEEIKKMVVYARNVIEDMEKMGSIFAETNVYMLHMMYQAMGVCLYMQDWDGAMKYGEKIIQPYSVHYPPYSLNVASMYLKLGRLYMGLERRSQGVKALKKALVIMDIAHGKDHPYIEEVKKEMDEQT